MPVVFEKCEAIASTQLWKLVFRHASVSRTYPCKLVDWFKLVSHTFGFPISGTFPKIHPIWERDPSLTYRGRI